MLEPGSPAPTFSLPGTHDGTLDAFELPDEPRQVYVLVFYPMDFSPPCTTEMCALRDVELFALEEDVALYGIGVDSAYSHRAFAREYNLGFPLLSDRLGDVAESYGVLADDVEGHPRVAKRSVFVVDVHRTVQYAWSTDDPEEQPDLAEITAAIEAIQDDRTAIERYDDAFAHLQYGESELSAARDAYDDEQWGLAIETFREASYYLDAAADGFTSSRRFGESDGVGAAATTAAEKAQRLRQAADWFATAARNRGDGDDEAAAEYERDALAAIEEVGDLPDIDIAHVTAP